MNTATAAAATTTTTTVTMPTTTTTATNSTTSTTTYNSSTPTEVSRGNDHSYDDDSLVTRITNTQQWDDNSDVTTTLSLAEHGI